MQFRRLVVPVTAAAAGAVVLALVYPGNKDEAGSASGIKVDRATSTSKATPIPATGMPVGTVREQWRTSLPNVPGVGWPKTRVEFVAGQVVVASPHGLDVFDANTGKPRWHYYETGRMLVNYAVTSDAVVLTTGATGPGGAPVAEGDRRLRSIGLDAATGRTLWTRDDLTPVTQKEPPATNPYVPFASPQAGVAVFRSSGSKPGLLAVDARSGKQRWTWDGKAAPQCVLKPQDDTDGSLLAVTVSCPGPEKTTTLFALDPASGAVAWQRPTAEEERSLAKEHPVTREKVTLVPPPSKPDKSTSVLVGADGRQLWKSTDSKTRAVELAVTGGRAVTRLSSPIRKTNNRLVVVNTSTGKEAKRIPTDAHDELIAVKGRVYGVRSLRDESNVSDSARALVPGGLDVIDPVKNEATTLPLPFGPNVYPVPPVDGAYPVADYVRGNRIYRFVSNGQELRLTAYGPGEQVTPVETAGVPLSDWPDACKLTANARGIGQRIPSAFKLGKLRIPAWDCRVRGTTDDQTVTLRIGWVSRTPDEAHALLSDLGSTSEKVSGFGDEAYSTILPNSRQAIAMRTGRYISLFMDPADTKDPLGTTATVMRTVDKTLRSH